MEAKQRRKEGEESVKPCNDEDNTQLLNAIAVGCVLGILGGLNCELRETP